MRPLNELVKRTEKKPDVTLLLLNEIKKYENTVKTFYFAKSIKEYFEIIFEKVATGKGCGFWVEAEYGAGKTHFLAALACLLTNFSDELWSKINNNEIKKYVNRIKNQKLFPVIINLKGEANIKGQDNLYNIIEMYIEESLEERELLKDVIINPSDELIKWYESRGFKNDIDEYINNSIKPDNDRKNKDYLAKLIQNYCIKEEIRPELATTTKDRFANIYNQIISQGYTGILFIIDEFECWQRKHAEQKEQQAIDEEILETLAWVLPRGNDLNIYTIVASQKQVPTKLQDGRFTTFHLLADRLNHDFDEIVAFRVREKMPDKNYEIEQYYEYYHKEFKFLDNINKEYFTKIFPFQPRCFQAIRAITQRELPSARAGIGVLWETMKDKILSRGSLIILSDLMESDDLIDDLNRENYEESYKAYSLAIDRLEDIFKPEEKAEKEIAKRIINTLFLWHIAYLEAPRYLSEEDITEATLTISEIGLKNEDETILILNKISRELPQIEYTKQKGAIFKISERSEVEPERIFYNMKKDRNDLSQIKKYWEQSLNLYANEMTGNESIFYNFEFEKPLPNKINYKKIEYPGEVILSKNWRAHYGDHIKDDLHFRVLFMASSDDIKIEEITDPRIAVCIPSELTEIAKEEARNLWTIKDMYDVYKDKTGSDADDARKWITIKKRGVIQNILSKQQSIYKNGKILTAKQIAINTGEIFSIHGAENFVKGIVTKLLSASYGDLIIQSTNFRGIFKPNDAKKIFEGLFRGGIGANESACMNFAVAMGLSETSKPNKFKPTENKVFQIIERLYQENNKELHLWKLYNELENKYGLTKEIVTLYVLCFVAKGQPSTEISLKPYSDVNITSNNITFGNIRQLIWRGKFYESFDSLSESTEIAWNDIVPYARIINNNIKIANTHEEIQAQELLLFQSLEGIKNKMNSVSENIKILSQKFEEKIDKERLAIIDRFNNVSESQNRNEFLNNCTEEDDDIIKFQNDYNEFNNLSIISDKSAELNEMKTYLFDVIIPEKDKLSVETLMINEQMKLGSFIKNPQLIDKVKENYKKFKNKYEQQYQEHHRQYYQKIKQIIITMEDVNLKIGAIEKLNKILKPNELINNTKNKYKDLLKKTVMCEVNEPLELNNYPYCRDCPSRINLSDKPPEEEVKEFVGNVEKELKKMKHDLSQLLSTTILEVDSGNRLDKLVKAINVSKIDAFLDILNDEIIQYINGCIDKSNIITEEKTIFSKILNKFSFVDDENMDEVVKAFREELVKALKEIKEKHPRKEVKLFLK